MGSHKMILAVLTALSALSTASAAKLPIVLESRELQGRSNITCPADINDFLLPDPEDCSQFYYCSNGEPSLYQCPDGLYFNPDLDVCDSPLNVDCTNPFSTLKLSSKLPTTERTNVTCPADINDFLLPDPKDCSQFYYCSNGEPSLYQCPDGLYFNPD